MSTQRRPVARRSRSIAATVLGIIAVLGVLASTVGIWANRTLYDTEGFGQVIDRTLADPAVSDAIAGYVADEAIRLLDVEAHAQQRVPSRLDRAAPAVTAALRSQIHRQVAQLLADPGVQKHIGQAARTAHATLLQVIAEGRVANVSLSQGAITVNLLPLITRGVAALPSNRITERVDLPELDIGGNHSEQLAELSKALGRPLPENLGLVQVYRGERVERAELLIAQAQRAIIDVHRFLTMLLIITGVAALASLVVSANRRRTLLGLLAGGFVAYGLALLAIERIVSQAPLLALDPANRGAISVIMHTWTRSLVVACLIALGVTALGWLVVWATGRRRAGSAG